MTEIDDRLRHYYRSLQLNEAGLQDIAQYDNGRARASGVFASWRLGGVTWVAAAVLLLSVSVGIHEYGTHSERTYRTLNEAAMNHSTRLQMEFEASTIVEIDQHMLQLPFKVKLPTEFNKQYSVLGARYCTISGELAAHVKFIDHETDKQVSLFMTRSVDDLQKINATREQVNGVNVSLWNESGLFYAMASRSPNIP
ncbi:MAG: peptide methionine sulfoxide reductase MsrA [Granulosicoccus sp.]|jgi:peptide methionine sulfoxide reductase MsrA